MQPKNKANFGSKIEKKNKLSLKDAGLCETWKETKIRSNGHTWTEIEWVQTFVRWYNNRRFIIFRRKIRPFTDKPIQLGIIIVVVGNLFCLNNFCFLTTSSSSVVVLWNAIYNWKSRTFSFTPRVCEFCELWILWMEWNQILDFNVWFSESRYLFSHKPYFFLFSLI